MTTQDTLNYFQQAGAVIGEKDFHSRLRLSPVGVAIGMAMRPRFDENNPAMSIDTDYVLNLTLDLRLDNSDGLLTANLPMNHFELYDSQDVLKKGFDLPSNLEQADDVITLRSTAQIALASRSDTAAQSPAFAYLGKAADADGKGARPEKWFKQVGELITDYARDTDFIIKSGHSVIVQPTPAPGSPEMPNEVVAMSPAVPPVPSVTVQQVDQSRRDRQEVMDAIIATFATTNRVVVTMTLDELRNDATLLPQANWIVDQHTEGKTTLESYIAQKVGEMTGRLLQSL